MKITNKIDLYDNWLKHSKVGDYGLSMTNFRETDYYIIGDVAVPLRWSDPASLDVTHQKLLTMPLTQKANIWTFGMTSYCSLTCVKRNSGFRCCHVGSA